MSAAEDEAAAARLNSNGFSTKEMLVRLDGKIDAVLAHQQSYDVDLALLKARAESIERDHRDQRIDDLALRAEVRKEIVRLDHEHEALARRMAYQTGAVATVVVTVNVAVPFVLHFIR